MLRKIQRVGKRATKFQYTATYQSVVVECTKDKWRPSSICVSWTRRGRRLMTKLRPWQPSPDNKARGVVIWPEQEIMEIVVTLYKGPKDQSYESKEWDFAVIDVDSMGKRKVLATLPINMVRYVSSLPFDHELHLRLKPVSRKIKAVILDVSIASEFLKEGKATDDDMMSIASMMSVSNLSTIGYLEDDEDDDYNYMVGVRSISPPEVPESILSTDELLKWAQGITRDLPDVRITNMTTSWRNGLGFLAVIHHFRPDLLPEFDVQSPNAIKENNRMAFSIARSLGIACPLTPNMMVTTTVPDKLSVTSFVYQMYQYFTKARMSAIAKAEREGAKTPVEGRRSQGTSPSSPFDMSKFEMFTKDLSPTTSPTGRTDRVMHYSRHSMENLHQSSQPSEPEKVEPRGESYTYHPKVDSKLLLARLSPPPGGQSSDNLDGNEGMAWDDARRSSLDQLVSEQASIIGKGSPQLSSTPKTNQQLDREVEFENMNTDSEESLQASSSAPSLLKGKSNSEQLSDINQGEVSTSASESGGAETLYKYTPGKDMEGSKKVATVSSGTSGPSGSGRKLPTVPAALGVATSDKKEERKRLVQEMLRKHKLDKFKVPENVSLDAISDTSNSSKYRREAINLLSEALGTPIKSRKTKKEDISDRSSDVSDDFISCGEGSATSLGGVDDNYRASSDKQEPSKPSIETRSDPDGAQSKVDKERKVRKLPLLLNATGEPVNTDRAARASSEERTTFTGSNERLKDQGVENNSSVRATDKSLSTASANLPVRSSTSPAGQEVQHPSHGRKLSMDTNAVAGDSEQVPPLPPRRNTLGSSDLDRSGKKEHQRSPVERRKKQIPVARPISARPSQILQRMLDAEEKEKARLKEEEEKRKQQAAKEAEEQRLKEAEEKEREEKLKEEREERLKEEKEKKEREEEEERKRLEALDQQAKEEEDSISPMKSSKPIPATTPKKTLPSPSAWSEHSDDLSKDLLVSQSDYVRSELKSLQSELQDLENRAQDIEADIRVSMSEGDKEKEEELMQEWFGVLNKKNEFIKRQLQLNMIEKEEDLEKRQFFLNRELRPLMEIPDEEKTTEQNERAEYLLKELLELIDERDRLEKRKMDNSRIKDYEREGLANAQAKSADIAQAGQQPQQPPKQTSKECVIS